MGGLNGQRTNKHGDPVVLPPTGDDLKRWRESLEHLGPEEVWSRLNRTTTLDPGEMVEICDPPLPTRSFVQGWLFEKRAKADRREWIGWWAAVIGAFAAAIAAFASVLAIA